MSQQVASDWPLKQITALQTQEGYPLVKPGPKQEPTRRVHAFGGHWAEQMGDGYELQTFNKAKHVSFFEKLRFFQRLSP